ncbi:ABC transporter permease [Kitasatospora sp. NPDC058190]|uniref:ABC transporter permease n=1 Tax=Kitasatospora sp. NPDC058190 TaxID=3346371 RepID=UPI0036D8D412
MKHYFLFELQRLKRDPRFLVLTLLLPVALYLLFGTVGGQPPGPEADRAHTLSMIGMACYAALMVTVTNGGNIAADRALGWTGLLRTTPLGARGVVLAKMASGLVLCLPSIVLVYVVGSYTQHLDLGFGTWLSIGVLTWIGSLPFAVLALSLGYASSPQSAGPTVMSTVLGLSALGGLWIPVDQFPDALKDVAKVLPTNRWASISQNIALGGDFHPSDVVVLLAWTAGFVLLARLCYRRGTPA